MTKPTASHTMNGRDLSILAGIKLKIGLHVVVNYGNAKLSHMKCEDWLWLYFNGSTDSVRIITLH